MKKQFQFQSIYQDEDRTVPPWNYYCGSYDIVTITVAPGQPDVGERTHSVWDVDRSLPTTNDPILLMKAKERNDLSKVIKQFGTWALTDYGMECLTWQYAIPASRIGRDEPLEGWQGHMFHKAWVNTADFSLCYEAAVEHFRNSIRTQRVKMQPVKPVSAAREPRHKRVRLIVTPRDRFIIFKRDGYRCRICGRNAADGVKLHVDHIMAKAKGGTAEHTNLWTLCSDCNLGKFTDDL